MTKQVPGLRWAPPFIVAALFQRLSFRRAVEVYWQDTLNWRWAEGADWPSSELLVGDFRHARDGGFGFVADVGTKQLFAVPRGWEEPEWQLAEVSLKDGRWRDLGSFEPWPPTWVMPELADHPSRNVS